MAGQHRPRTAKRAPVGAGQRIIASLKEAIAGNFVRATVDGQVWERVDQKQYPRETRIRKIMNRYTEARHAGGGQYRPCLKIDHQSWTLNEFPDDKKTANWHRRQLAIALNRFKYGD